MPKKINPAILSDINISENVWKPFCYNRLQELMRSSDSPDGQKAVVLFFRQTLKHCDNCIYYVQFASEEEGNGLPQIHSLPAKKFIERYLTSFLERGIKPLLNHSHRPFKLVFDPKAPSCNNFTFKINLFEVSPFSFETVSHLTQHPETASQCEYFIRKLCNNDDEMFHYICWYAWSVVSGFRTHKSLVFTGAQATGKSTFVHILQSLLTPNMHTRGKIGHLGKFNGSLVNKCLAVFEELPAHLTQENISSLKDLITGHVMVAEDKFVQSKNVPNFLNIIINSNYNLETLTGRRFCHIHPKKDAISELELVGFADFCKTVCNPSENHSHLACFYELFRSKAEAWTRACIEHDNRPVENPPNSECTYPDSNSSSSSSIVPIVNVDPSSVVNEFICNKLIAHMTVETDDVNLYIHNVTLANEYLDFVENYSILNRGYIVPGRNKTEKKKYLYEYLTTVMHFGYKQVRKFDSLYYFYIDCNVLYDFLLKHMNIDSIERMNLLSLGERFGVIQGYSENVDWQPITENLEA